MNLEKFRILKTRKKIVEFLNSSLRVHTVSDERFEELKKIYEINKFFESKNCFRTKTILMSKSNLPDRKIINQILKDDNVLVVCRLRQYIDEGFSKTYTY